MGQIEDLRLFVTVVEEGGIARAAQQMHIAKSAVSRRLALMEERYGTRLIDRRPGHWSVTPEGRELRDRASRLVQDAEEIETDFLHPSQSPEGPLSLSVPREFGLGFLQPALLDFARNHPGIVLNVDFDDRQVDLGQENYDLAIRISEDPHPHLQEHQLGLAQHALYASPAYLLEHGTPQTIAALSEHALLHFGPARRAEWELDGTVFRFQPRLNATSGLFLLEATLAGLGVARLPGFIAGHEPGEGRLTRVLSQVKHTPWPIKLVHARERRQNRRMRLFIDAMQKACSQLRA